MTFRKDTEKRKRIEGLERRVNRIRNISAEYFDTFKVDVPKAATNISMSRLVEVYKIGLGFKLI